MENEFIPYENPYEENRRPGFLTLLCVLTFIGSGFSLLTNLLLPVFAPAVLDIVRQSPPFPGVVELYEQFLEVPVWQFYLLALFCATSLLGAIYMLKMKKIGFHIYAVSQLIQICIGYFVIGGQFKPNFFSLFITALFIGLYAIFYKKFTALEEEKVTPDE